MKGRFCFRIFACIVICALFAMGSWAEDAVHVVQKGETLFGIARAKGLAIQELLDANHLTTKSAIKVGQKLVLPGKGSTISTAPSAATVPTSGEYQVKKGDTLYAIARQSGVDVKVLQKLNNLSDKSGISVGQVLKLPASNAVASQTSPAASPSTKPSAASASVASASDPGSSQSVDMAANTAQATEGTLLKTKPYVGGANLSWPHPGERLLVDGKLPGLLIKANKGDTVRAVSDGKVVYSGPHSTLGHIVFVQNAGGFIFIYGGNEGSSLKAGDSVKTGDVIGQVGLTPGFPETEIYFSTWKDGAYIDPASAPRG